MLTTQQIEELQKPLSPDLVKTRPDNKMSYVEGWAVEDTANQIFKFNWYSQIIELVENTPPTKNKNNNFIVSFRCKIRVTAAGIIKEGVGFGSGIKSDIHAAYEDAIKEAETDAQKRAFKKFGHRFGLTLYDKEKKNVKSVDVYEIEQERCDFLKAQILDLFKKQQTKKGIGQAWLDRSVDIAFIKKNKKENYQEILKEYGNLKGELPE